MVLICCVWIVVYDGCLGIVDYCVVPVVLLAGWLLVGGDVGLRMLEVWFAVVLFCVLFVVVIGCVF